MVCEELYLFLFFTIKNDLQNIIIQIFYLKNPWEKNSPLMNLFLPSNYLTSQSLENFCL